ncbi:MAG: peptidoglycan DD-metalloendopeptidase family protein [Oscillospiraceae bacterium]|nr:peptidoglycan DD-metalloendopeptidase family protein [Oscillospiraceae bacterium]
MGKINRMRSVPFWGRMFAAVICAAVAVTAAGDAAMSVSASASGADSAISSLQKESERLKQINEERKKQISALQGDISGNTEAMRLVSDQIDGIRDEMDTRDKLITIKMELIDEKSAEIDAIILTIADKEREISDKQLEIADLRAQNKENLARFARLARALYMNNSSNMLPILNGSDDWYEYFVYSDIVKNISAQNVLFMERLQNSINQQETLIGELDRSIERLESDRAELERQKAEFEQQRADLEREREELDAYAKEQIAYLNSLKKINSQIQSQIDSLNIKISEDNKQIEKNNAEIDRIIKEAQDANKDQTVYNDGFLWPVSGEYRRLTDTFKYYAWRGGYHGGIDIVGSYAGQIHNADIYAAQSGTVIVAAKLCPHLEPKNPYVYHSCGQGFGNYIVIDHGGGVTTLYAHCEQILVKQGQKVTKGDVIGKVGSSGWSSGYHLHFETRVNNVRKDPQSYVYQYK